MWRCVSSTKKKESDDEIVRRVEQRGTRLPTPPHRPLRRAPVVDADVLPSAMDRALLAADPLFVRPADLDTMAVRAG